MEDKFIFSMTVESVQEVAIELIKRRLTDSELIRVKRGIENGLLADIHAVIETAISDVVE